MFRRLATLALIMLAIGPGPWVRLTRSPDIDSQRVTARPLALPPGTVSGDGGVRIAEAWQLTSPNTRFGGYSALLLTGRRRFLLASDTGTVAGLTLAAPGRRGAAATRTFFRPLPDRERHKDDRTMVDMESLTTDRNRRHIWIGFEQQHSIWRFDAGLTRTTGHVAPPAMRGWPSNGGAEAMVRLHDGRFILFSETGASPLGGTEVLLFAADPVANPHLVPARSGYDAGGMGRVTDAAELPDGRLLLLHRGLAVQGPFVTTIALVDPAAIKADTRWRAKAVATIGPPYLSENFEGVAVEDGGDPSGAGATAVWLISDDNLMRWQRTLLLRLLLPPAGPHT